MAMSGNQVEFNKFQPVIRNPSQDPIMANHGFWSNPWKCHVTPMVKIVSWYQHSKMVTYNNTNPHFWGDFWGPKTPQKLLVDTFSWTNKLQTPGFIQLKESEGGKQLSQETDSKMSLARKKMTPKNWKPRIHLLGYHHFCQWFFALKNFGGVIAQAFNGCFWFPLKGGRWHIIPQLAVYITYIYIPHIVLAFWGVI